MKLLENEEYYIAYATISGKKEISNIIVPSKIKIVKIDFTGTYYMCYKDEDKFPFLTIPKEDFDKDEENYCCETLRGIVCVSKDSNWVNNKYYTWLKKALWWFDAYANEQVRKLKEKLDEKREKYSTVIKDTIRIGIDNCPKLSEEEIQEYFENHSEKSHRYCWKSYKSAILNYYEAYRHFYWWDTPSKFWKDFDLYTERKTQEWLFNHEPFQPDYSEDDS